MKNNIIFLISQPRSGSSFLQIQLSLNKSIYSPPESSFLLKYLYKYNNFDRLSYDTVYFEHSVNDFLQKEKYILLDREFRKFVLNFYNNYGNSRNLYYLDKSPRYYHILSSLLRIFPDSKFIILLRNPLAVLNSILRYHYDYNLNKSLSEYTCNDLFYCLKVIDNIWKKRAKYENVHFTKYEDLIDNKEKSIGHIYQFINLRFDNLTNEINSDFISSSFVDPTAKKNLNPIKSNSKNWLNNIDTLQKKNIFLFYYKFISNLDIIKFHYNLDDLYDLLLTKDIVYKPYIKRTNKFFKNSFKFFK